MLKWRCVSTHFYFIISNEGTPSFSWFILVEIVMEDIDFIRIFVVILKILSTMDLCGVRECNLFCGMTLSLISGQNSGSAGNYENILFTSRLIYCSIF